MFYFTEDVIQLKAWQLYLGNAFWTLFVGLVLLIIVKVLGLVGIQSDTLRNIIHETRHLTGAENPEQIRRYASAVLPEDHHSSHHSNSVPHHTVQRHM